MMQRGFLLGGLSAMLLLTGGLFLYQGYSQTPDPAADAIPPPPPGPVAPLPVGNPKLVGTPPPAVPEARQETREERRFQRYDRDRNGIVSRVEMMSTRSAAFRRLDTDGNNLLSFEEWAVTTSERFATADRDGSSGLNRTEFATTAPPRRPRSACAC